MEAIKLNLIPNGASPVAHASQYDEGRRFRCDLFEGAEVYTLDGTEVLECDIKKPDGNIVTVAVTNTSDSYIVVETTLQMCACAGNSFGEIKITKDAKDIGTLNFILAVERSPLEGGIESDSGIHNLQEQIGEAVAEQYSGENVVFDSTPTAGHGVGFAVTSEGVKAGLDEKANTDDLAPVATSGDYSDLDNLPTIPENLPDLGDVEITSPTAGQILEYDDNAGKWKNVANPASTTNFGAPYDPTATYNVPSLVIENNLLYKLNDGEVDVTGPFDPTKWTQTSVAELTAEDFPLSSTDPTTTREAISEKISHVGNAKDCFVGGATNNLTTYTFQFDNPGLSTNYKHFIMFGGTFSNEAFMYIGWCPDGTETKPVTLTPILAGNRTFTATYDQSNGRLTINANSPVYGGIKVIWIN